MSAINPHSRTPLTALLAVAVLLLLSLPAHAQRFQDLFGSNNCVEEGDGTVQLANGGYVTVGHTYSMGVPCGVSSVYVVSVNANGTLNWSNTYPIGVADSATDVIETANGDFALCGVTTNAFGNRDAFVLRLNPVAGAVVAFGTVDLGGNEILYDIVEAQTGGPGLGGLPGDFITAGTAIWANMPPGARDGLIIRWSAAAGPGLVMAYGTLPADDYFYGVEEAIIGVAGGAIGDIVAVGGTFSYTAGPGTGGGDIWVVRVNGGTGLIGVPPQNAATFGGYALDEAYSVIEVRTMGYTTPGNLVVAGRTMSAPAPSTNWEGFVLQTPANPCLLRVADMIFGDNGMGADMAYDVKEDPFTPVAVGGVIVAGASGTGTTDMFLQRFALGTLALLGNAMLYGGNGNDVGYAVDPAIRMSPVETQGYILAGYSQSQNLHLGDPSQLYLAKTDIALSSGCNEMPFTFYGQDLFAQACPAPALTASLNACCLPPPVPTMRTWSTQLCYALPKARERGGNGNDGVSGVEAPAVVSFDERSVMGYPNPITRGASLNLRFDLSKRADAKISVSDVIGSVIYRTAASIDAGPTTYSLDTEGWSAGIYLVNVMIGDRSATARVVVLDR